MQIIIIISKLILATLCIYITIYIYIQQRSELYHKIILFKLPAIMLANALPDELVRKILESGVQNRSFTYKDLCCLSIACRRLHRLSAEDSLWSHLLSSDFPNNSSHSSSSSSASSIKAVYRTRFEKDRERKLAAHRRAVLRKESQVAENFRKVREIEIRLRDEADKLKFTSAELSNLRRAR